MRMMATPSPTSGPAVLKRRARKRRHKKGPRRSGVRSSPVELKLELDRDGFGVEIIVQYRFAHFAPPTGLLVTTERQCRIEYVVAVDPYGPRLELRRQGVRLTDVAGPDAGCEPINAVIRLAEQILVHIRERDRGHHGAEDLLLNNLHVRPGIDEHGGFDKIPRPLPRLATGNCPSAFLLAHLKIPAHPVALRLGHHRTHFCRGVESRAELDGLSVRSYPFHDLVENALLDVKTRAGTAALTVVEENGARRARNGDIQVRIL